jgi:hypothetical protein
MKGLPARRHPSLNRSLSARPKQALNKSIPFMVRQAHHERNHPFAVHPEPVEGHGSAFPQRSTGSMPSQGIVGVPESVRGLMLENAEDRLSRGLRTMTSRVRRQQRGPDDGRPRCRHPLNNRVATTLVRGIRAWSEAPRGVSDPIRRPTRGSRHAKSAPRQAKGSFILVIPRINIKNVHSETDGAR